RIRFVLDRVEMGQGTMTSHAALLAEELDVDPARIEVELAPADRAYDNLDPQTPFQVTGGSTSVKTSWEPLRRAGATGRGLLRGAAGRPWGVPLAGCIAADGVVHHAASARSARYGELAAAAAAEKVPQVTLKDPAQFRFIGKPLRRLDGRAKV